tara:strand:- start:301 stop:522 length:222 start_codon:yes stop_codon:yes gene_type:complete
MYSFIYKNYFLSRFTIEKPEFTISFLSTVICQSLEAGIIPICIFEREQSNIDFIESVYPMRKWAFFGRKNFWM